MINFVFYIKTFENGDTLPLIKSEPPFDELSDLSNGFVGTINGAIKIIDNIEKVISEEKDSYIFGGSDFVILGVGKDTTTITSFFDEEEKVNDIPTEEILSLMKDWLNYLIDFKNKKQ